MLSALFSALHLLGLPLAIPSVLARGRALARRDVAAALLWDNLWGLSAVLMIGTGLMRAFGGLEKGTEFYLQHGMFWGKMGLLGAVLLLELWPMAVLIRWRIDRARGREPDPTRGPALARICVVQAVLVIAMVFAAAMMARAIGY